MHKLTDLTTSEMQEFAGGFGAGIAGGFVAVAALYYVIKNV